jgi:hypothetical protein
MFVSSTSSFILKSGYDHFDPHLGYRLENSSSKYYSWHVQDIFIFSKVPRSTLGNTQRPIQSVPEGTIKPTTGAKYFTFTIQGQT